MEIIKQTNLHLHAPNEQTVSCCEMKEDMKRVRDLQDSSHHVVSESLQTVTEGTAAKLAKLDSLKPNYTAPASASACRSSATHHFGAALST